MVTVETLAAGVYNWNKEDQARLERNKILYQGELFQALRFCRFRNGRHTRVHLVITEEDWIRLFENAVQNGVFSSESRNAMMACLQENRSKDEK